MTPSINPSTSFLRHFDKLPSALRRSSVQASSVLRTPNGGLGLAFCKKIIDAHNGLISVESKPAEGSTFKIIMPKS